MKRKFVFFSALTLLIVLFAFLSLQKTKSKGGTYLFPPKNTNIYTEPQKLKDIKIPYKGNIKGALFLKGEKAEIKVNKKLFFINGNYLLYFPKEEKTNIILKRGKVFAFNFREFKLSSSVLKKRISFPKRTFLRLLIKREDNLYEVKEIITKSFTPPKDSKTIIQDRLDSENWKKKFSFLKNYSYIKVNNTAYQVNYFDSDFEKEIKFKLREGMRLSFYAGSVNSLTKSDLFNTIGDGTVFSIYIQSGGKRVNIFEKRILNNVEYFDIRIPKNGDSIIFKASHGKDFIGDISFWGSPYVYFPREKRKIVLLISLDTVRAKSLSLYNKDLKTSPFLKRWASEECEYFQRAYTTHPWTTEAHRSVFFSTHSWDKKEKSLSEFLQEKGFYTIALTGGNLVSSGLGFARGFTSYLDDNFNLFNREAGRVLFKRAKTYIEAERGKDIFLFLHTYQAHSPYMPPLKYSVLGAKGVVDMFSMTKGVRGTFSPLADEIRKKAKTLYEEEILTIDQDFLKPLIKFLKQKNLYKDTIIVIFGDHGEQFYEHGSWEHGYSLYEEEVRVPLIFKDYGSKKGRSSEELISLNKIPFMISNALGFKSYKGWKLEEKDYVIFSTSPEYSLLSFPFKIGIIKDNYKLIYNIKIDKRKFEKPPILPKYELYDLSSDPDEKINIIYKRKKEFRELKRILNFYYKRAASQRRKSLEKIKKNLKSLGYVD